MLPALPLDNAMTDEMFLDADGISKPQRGKERQHPLEGLPFKTRHFDERTLLA